ncbi:MAG: phospholipase D-like domain-containing protein [Acidobacteriota bacterium]
MSLLAVVSLILGLLAFAVGLTAAVHALLWKRNPRSAMGWILLTAFFPVLGAFLYWFFGVNRIETRARRLDELSGYVLGSSRPDPRDLGEEADGAEAPEQSEPPEDDSLDTGAVPVSGALRSRPEAFAPGEETLALPDEYRELARISRAVTGWPLMPGHRIEVLHDGDEAYPAMLEALASARHRIVLCTYIFDGYGAGRRFVDELIAAHRRGVEVKVLIDGVGELYSKPRARPALEAAGIPVALFLPPSLFPPNVSVNLRTHRKILVVDGCLAFTGGINIRQRHVLAEQPDEEGVADIHFRLQGPAAASMESVFLDDWAFVSGGDSQQPEPCAPQRLPASDGITVEASANGAVTDEAADPGALCRLVADGPNEDLDKLIMILIGAISAARHRVAVMTPYFLPPRSLLSAFQAAALRGVEVLVVLPQHSNLPPVDWATRNMLWELLQRGVRVVYQRPPFAHSKLFTIDGHYALVGSTNLDPRSLRLNFELCVEVYHRPTVETLDRHIDAAAQQGEPVTLAEVDGRPWPQRLRDSLCWLFSPYL